MTVRLLHGDCREVLRSLVDESIDACVTDPPYHLTTARPGGRSEATRGAVMGGFMGMQWDGGDVAFDPATWREVLRVLKPGGYLLAFGGTRTYHRLACAIEDAGFEIRDQVGWAFGSGFPKSHNGPWGGTALKPAWEPICMARRPLIGTVEANWREHGTGALNIDGCRIPTGDDLNGGAYSAERQDSASPWAASGSLHKSTGEAFEQPPGRWPANLIHDGSEEVLAAFPREAGASAPVRGTEPSKPAKNVYGTFARGGGAFHNDTGSAARFFYCAKADRADRNDGLHGMPEQMPANAVDRPAQRDGTAASSGRGSKSQPRANHHPTVKPTDLMRYLCRLVTPKGGTVLDPFAGSGSTLKAAELEGFGAIGIELQAEYVEIARRRIASDAPLFAEVAA
jgi:site-specific DNA-methyltransferase (adenine-specific)